MRSYIELEKEFIKFLIKSERGNRKLLNFIDPYLVRSKLIVNIEKEEAEFKYEVEDATKAEIFDWIVVNASDLEEIIAILIKLILYLENQGYIASYKMTPDAHKAEWSFGQGVDEDLRLSIPFPDEEIVKNLISYLFKEIIPLQPLKDLATNNFITPEERRFRKQYKLAISGIVISIIIGLSVIILNIRSQNNHNVAARENSRHIKDAINLLDNINSNIIEAKENQLNASQKLNATLQKVDITNSKSLDEISIKLGAVSKSINKLSKGTVREQPKTK